MNRINLTTIVFILIAFLYTLTLAGCGTPPHQTGPMQAHLDVMQNKLELRSSGILFPTTLYKRFLRDRLGVCVHVYNKRTLPDDPQKIIFDYNAIVIAELEKRHGKGILQKLDKEFNFITNRDYYQRTPHSHTYKLQMSDFFLPSERPKPLNMMGLGN